MNLLRNTAAALILMMGAAAHAVDFGVQVQVDVPLEAVTTFPNVLPNYDLLGVSAFYEDRGFGLRLDFLSHHEFSLGAYRIVHAVNLGVIGGETSVGAYTGYNWAGEGWFFRIRGKFLLYGSF